MKTLLKPTRIQICGPSGVGKTELANFISLSLGIPFISTSTKPLWKSFNIKTHKELIELATKDPYKSNEFQHKVLEYRENVLQQSLMDKPLGYVADRSPIDNMVYYIMQNTLHSGVKETEEYQELCTEALKSQCDKIIRIVYNPKNDVSDDGTRVANPFYQQQVEAVFQSLFKHDNLRLTKMSNIDPRKDILTINTWDWNKRVEMVQDFLGLKKNLIKKLWAKGK